MLICGELSTGPAVVNDRNDKWWLKDGVPVKLRLQNNKIDGQGWAGVDASGQTY